MTLRVLIVDKVLDCYKMVRFGFLFGTGTGGGFVRTQRIPLPYGSAFVDRRYDLLRPVQKQSIKQMAAPESSVHRVNNRLCYQFLRLPNERKLFTEMFKKDNVA